MHMINGKEYSDSEVLAIYWYQEQRFHEQDIEQGIYNVIETDSEEASWLDNPVNRNRVEREAESRLDKWLDLQAAVLSGADASLMTLTEELVHELYREDKNNAIHTQDPH